MYGNYMRDEQTPSNLKGWSNMLLITFHAIFMQILNYGFCAISSRDLSVCTFSDTFSFVYFQWVSWNCRSTNAMETFLLYTHMDVHMAPQGLHGKTRAFNFSRLLFTDLQLSAMRCSDASNYRQNIFHFNDLTTFTKQIVWMRFILSLDIVHMGAHVTTRFVLIILSD